MFAIATSVLLAVLVSAAPAQTVRIEKTVKTVRTVPATPAVAPPASRPAVIRATGIGKPPRGKSPVVARLMARRAAEVVAVRNLARKLHSQPRPGSRSYTTHRATRIAGFRYLQPVYRPDGSVEVTVEMSRPVLRR